MSWVRILGRAEFFPVFFCLAILGKIAWSLEEWGAADEHVNPLALAIIHQWQALSNNQTIGYQLAIRTMEVRRQSLCIKTSQIRLDLKFSLLNPGSLQYA